MILYKISSFLFYKADKGTPSIDDWLKLKLKDAAQPERTFKVYQNSKFTSIASWNSRLTAFKDTKIQLTDVLPDESARGKSDLVDIVWPEDERPSKPADALIIHEKVYAGKSIKEKLALVMERMKSVKADVFVVTALDEVAWLFNLRGTDVPNNPMFFSYAIVDALNNQFMLFTDLNRVTPNIQSHLNADGIEVQVLEYGKIFETLESISISSRVWIAPQSSFAILNAVKKNRARSVRYICISLNYVVLFQ